jgi:hypothetical protein
VIIIVHLYTKPDIKITQKFSEELVAYFPLIRHGLLGKDAYNNSSMIVCAFVAAENVLNFVIQIIFGEKYNL